MVPIFLVRFIVEMTYVILINFALHFLIVVTLHFLIVVTLHFLIVVTLHFLVIISKFIVVYPHFSARLKVETLLTRLLLRPTNVIIIELPIFTIFLTYLVATLLLTCYLTIIVVILPQSYFLHLLVVLHSKF